MSRMRTILIVFVLVCAAGYSGFWWYQAQRLQTKLWQEYGITSDSVKKQGFPLSIDLVLENPQGFFAKMKGDLLFSFSVMGTLRELRIPEPSQIDIPMGCISVDDLCIQLSQTKPVPNRQNVHLITRIAGLKITTQDNPYHKLTEAIDQKAGKNQLKFDLELGLPSNQTLKELVASPLMLLTHLPEFSFKLNSFESSDNIQTSKWNGHLFIGEDQNKNVKVSFSSDMSSKYWPGLYDVLLQSVEPYLKGVVPNVADFGTIEAKNDGFVEFNKFTGQWQVQLADFALSCDLYGVRLGGNVQGNLGGISSAKAEVDTKNAPQLIRDAIGYYNRLIAAFEPSKKPLASQTADKIIAYLKEVSSQTPKTPDHMLFVLQYKDGIGSFGTLSFDEFMTKTRALWNAVMQETAPEPASQPSENKQLPLEQHDSTAIK